MMMMMKAKVNVSSLDVDDSVEAMMVCEEMLVIGVEMLVREYVDVVIECVW